MLHGHGGASEGGRKPKLDAKEAREIRALMRDPQVKVADIAKRYGVSRTTIYKCVGVVEPQRSSNG